MHSHIEKLFKLKNVFTEKKWSEKLLEPQKLIVLKIAWGIIEGDVQEFFLYSNFFLNKNYIYNNNYSKKMWYK
jgi:hypothetical protein